MNEHGKNKNEGENKDEKKDKDNKQIGKEAFRPMSPDSPDFRHNARHKRLLHRLKTARWVIWGGVVFISGCCSSEGGIGTNTIFMTAISALASIVTLAIGYIAGSNIERL